MHSTFALKCCRLAHTSPALCEATPTASGEIYGAETCREDHLKYRVVNHMARGPETASDPFRNGSEAHSVGLLWTCMTKQEEKKKTGVSNVSTNWQQMLIACNSTVDSSQRHASNENV